MTIASDLLPVPKSRAEIEKIQSARKPVAVDLAEL